MTPDANIEQETRRYLLGSLSEDALGRVEKRLLAEENFLEELTLAEAELIDDYVGGRLSAGERTEFEQYFLSSDERRWQLRFAQALSRYASAEVGGGGREAATPARPTFGERLSAFWGDRPWATSAALALCVVAFIAGAVWLTRTGAPRTFNTLALVATAGDRAEGVRPPRLRLPLGADALQVTLSLPESTPPAARYRVELLGDKGRTENLEAEGGDGRSVTVVIPEARLARGQYALRLFGVGADGAERRMGSYLFDVE